MSEQGIAADKRSGRLAQIDGLKFIMAVIIAIYHYHCDFTVDDVMRAPLSIIFRGIYENGFLFVETFFAYLVF